MARINWNKSAPYEHIVGKETGEKIYAIMEYLGVGKKHEALRFAIDFTCKELIEKPFKPAEPERKKGKWVVHDYAFGRERYECSGCKERCDLEYHFCPNCGADMRGE